MNIVKSVRRNYYSSASITATVNSRFPDCNDFLKKYVECIRTETSAESSCSAHLKDYLNCILVKSL